MSYPEDMRVASTRSQTINQTDLEDVGYRDEFHIIETIRANVGDSSTEFEGFDDGGWGVDIAQAVAEFMDDHGRAFREVRPEARILKGGRLDIYLERAPILGVAS